MDMTFFHKEGDGYRRFDTANKERAYSIGYLKEQLEKAEFTVEALYDDGSFEEPSSQSERIFFVCRRNG